MASLHKDPRKKSPFWYCAYCTRDEEGKLIRRYRSTKTTDKKEAVQICNTWAKVSALGTKLTPEKARQVIAQGVADVLMSSGQTLPSATIRDWCKRWLEIKGLESETRTHERYETTIKRFVEFLGTKAGDDLNSLTVDTILKFRESLARRVSPASANLELKVLRACLHSAQKQDLVERNVASKVDTLKDLDKSKIKRRSFTLAEVQKVLKQCDEAGGEWRGLVLAGLYTGQRLGDVAQMTWNQVDLAKGQISFVTRKTGARLSFSMAKPLAEHMTNLSSSDKPTAYVFPQAAAMAEKQTGVISGKFYDEILVPAGLMVARPKSEAKSGGKGRSAKRQVSELSYHSLRHTFTTWLKSSGASNAMAQMIVGHDSEVVSRGYTHLSADDTADAIGKLPDVTLESVPKKKLPR